MRASQKQPSVTDSRSIKWSHRDIPLAYGRHQCGRVAWTPEPQSIPVGSQLESDILSYLIHEGHMVSVHSQPFTVAFVEDDGSLRHYTPDFLVVFDRVSRALIRMGFDRWTAVEVKPSSRVDADVRHRLQAVHDQLGLATVCMTERDLPQGRN